MIEIEINRLTAKYKDKDLSSHDLETEINYLQSTGLITPFVKAPVGPMSIDEFICYIRDLKGESLYNVKGFLHDAIEIDNNLSRSFYTIDQESTIKDLREKTSRIIKTNGGEKPNSDKFMMVKDILQKYVEYEKATVRRERGGKGGKGIMYACIIVPIVVGIAYFTFFEEKPY